MRKRHKSKRKTRKRIHILVTRKHNLYENKINLTHNKKIPSNYRKKLKKIYLERHTNKVKKDRNTQ
jgi:hypothetical protein